MTVDVTVRLQALDGTWETCGADRAIGVNPESFHATANEWGPDKASFDLHRSVIALWPDLGAFTPVEVEVGGVVVWDGRTGETPMRGGADQVINVQCQGWQYHLDDDVYQWTYVHSKLSDWKDARGFLTTNLASLTTNFQVITQQGQILLSATPGSPVGQFQSGGVALDLGRSEGALRIVVVYAGGGSADYALQVNASNVAALGTEVASSIVHAAALPTEETTFAISVAAARYVSFQLFKASAGTAEPDSTAWAKLTKILIFANTAYEAGNASILKASQIVPDALERATLLLSSDRSQINPTTFPIPDFTMSKASTPREAIEAANAYHNWIAKLLIGRRMQFKARPTDPLLEIGAWSGANVEDASANNGAEIYNRALVEASGPDGSPLVVTRVAGDQAGIPYSIVSVPAPDNPSFAVDAANWSAVTGSIARELAISHSAPASGKWLSSGEDVLTTTFTGTFRAGRTYRLFLWVRDPGGLNKPEYKFGTATDYGYAYLGAPPGGEFTQVSISWAPQTDTTVAKLSIRCPFNLFGFYVDDLTLAIMKPTLVGRRGFRRTKVIQMSSAITEAEGKQLADIFLQAHSTTPFKGSATITSGGVRTVLGGQPVHPSTLLLRTQELLRLSHLTDPDTGGIGRDSTIAEVTYTHKDQKAAVTLDDKRGSFDALLSRLAVVQSVGA